MYGENSDSLRAELVALLRQHRILLKIGGPARHTPVETTTTAERAEIGELVRRYRQSVLAWVQHTHRVAATDLGRTTPAFDSSASSEFRRLLSNTLHTSSAQLASLAELTQPQPFPLVDTWRRAAQASALGEHDFPTVRSAATLSGHERLVMIQDAASITRGLVVLDRRYRNIPAWETLRDAGRLGSAAEALSAATSAHTDLGTSVDHRGWRPPLNIIQGPGLPGLVGLLQAEHNLAALLNASPDAHALRLILDSQRIVSQTAARGTASASPRASHAWERRADAYAALVVATRDLRGLTGSRHAIGEAAAAASRAQQLRTPDFTNAGDLRHLQQLFAQVDTRLDRRVTEAVHDHRYVQRLPTERLEHAPSLVHRVDAVYVPLDAPVKEELLDLFHRHLGAPAPAPRSQGNGHANRTEFTEALSHRPPQRHTPTGPSL